MLSSLDLRPIFVCALTARQSDARGSSTSGGVQPRPNRGWGVGPQLCLGALDSKGNQHWAGIYHDCSLRHHPGCGACETNSQDALDADRFAGHASYVPLVAVAQREDNELIQHRCRSRSGGDVLISTAAASDPRCKCPWSGLPTNNVVEPLRVENDRLRLTGRSIWAHWCS